MLGKAVTIVLHVEWESAHRPQIVFLVLGPRQYPLENSIQSVVGAAQRIENLARILVPKDRRLPLIGDANSYDVTWLDLKNYQILCRYSHRLEIDSMIS